MRNILLDRHHSDLYYGLQLLFEDRLHWAAFAPLGMEWYDAGYWAFDVPSDPGALARQYLTIDAKYREVEPGLYLTFDPGHPERPLWHVSLERARGMGWHAAMASVQQNQPGYRRFADETGAAYLYHIGNARQQVSWELDPLALVAAEAPIVGRGILVGEEFDSDTTFRYRPPVTTHEIASFVNLLPLIEELWPTYLAAGRLLPDFTFRSFGHSCPDGNLQPTASVAEQMARSGWGWHDKVTGDGFGHVIHGWAAVGRPLIGHSEYYAGQRAAALWEDGVTCVDLSVHPLDEAAGLIREVSADPERHEAMCRAIRDRFDSLYDWQADAAAVAEALR